MTDQELINRLKRFATDLGSDLVFTAADRIRELESKLALMMFERDEAWKRAAHSEKMWGEAEVKLAKAVEALREISCKCVSNCDWERGDICPSWTIRTVLGELEGENE